MEGHDRRLEKPDTLLADLAPFCGIEKGAPLCLHTMEHPVGQAGSDFVQRKEGSFPAGVHSSLSGHMTKQTDCISGASGSIGWPPWCKDINWTTLFLWPGSRLHPQVAEESQ